MALQFLYGLDRSSAQFPDQLDQFFHDEQHVQSIQNLPGDELSEFLRYLNSVLERLDHTGQPFRKCLHVLYKICGTRAVLPLSYQVSGALSSMSEHPVAFGGFGDVFKAKVDSGADVCVKKFRVCSTDNIDEIKQSVYREAAVWKHLSHPNIVPFLGVTLEPLQLVSEWMPGGELRQHVERRPNTNLINLLLDIAEGLAYLHSCNVIHGDLKGPNIMVDESGNARITDFGLTTIARSPHSHRSTHDDGGHTARWCAPELLASGQPANTKSDVFSFGMIIIEVFTGKAPFGEFKTPAVIASITTGKIPGRPNHPGFTDDLWELTLWCLKQAPSDRPTAGQVLATLKAIDRSRRAFPPPHNRTAGRFPVRQRRNAGATPPGILYEGKLHSKDKIDDESVCVSDNTLKPRNRSVMPCPIRSLYSPPHLQKWPNDLEKISLDWPGSDSSVSTSVQHTKKHRLPWSQIKRFICCGQ